MSARTVAGDQSDALRASLTAVGQGHVFRFWETLDSHARSNLTRELSTIDLEELGAMRKALERLRAGLPGAAAAGPPSQATDEGAGTAQMLPSLAPGPMLPLESPDFPWPLHPDAREAVAIGEELLREGKVAALLVAGGQGTRLGFDRPKGLLPILPVSAKTFFDIFADQLRALGRRYGRIPPFYVMTSDATHDESAAAFDSRRSFGLNGADVRFFRQRSLPALDDDGKIMLASQSSVALAPDGHGGCLAALKRHGLLEDMARRGCEWIFYFQVDNPLVHICDPAFLGLSAKRDADFSLKAARKKLPDERVGVFALANGSPRIVEYSELDAKRRNERDGSGLRYCAGNTAIHVLRRSFIERVTRDEAALAAALPLHVAHKKVATVDPAGRPVKPHEANGWKFERFFFDALPSARNVFALEIAREAEFLPVKEATGTTAPDTVRAAMQALWRRQLAAHGLAVAAGTTVEIAPALWFDDGALRRALASATIYDDARSVVVGEDALSG